MFMLLVPFGFIFSAGAFWNLALAFIQYVFIHFYDYHFLLLHCVVFQYYLYWRVNFTLFFGFHLINIWLGKQNKRGRTTESFSMAVWFLSVIFGIGDRPCFSLFLFMPLIYANCMFRFKFGFYAGFSFYSFIQCHFIPIAFIPLRNLKIYLNLQSICMCSPLWSLAPFIIAALIFCQLNYLLIYN